MRRILALLLTLSLALGLSVPVWAAPDREEDQSAWALYHLGLFRGVGEDALGFPIFALDQIPTRAEGVAMLVRLLGRESDAKNGVWETPFTDVPQWAAPYVGYAYAQKVTNGVSETGFAPDVPITATEYLTLVLRAMGYVSGEDFAWDQAWNLSDALGITDGQYGPMSAGFDRGDVAWISYRALQGKVKRNGQVSGMTLREILKRQGIQSDADQVIWEETLQTCQENQMVFSIAPVSGSDRTYLEFTVDAAWANGLPCQIRQYSTKQEVASQCKRIGSDAKDSVGEDAFALVYLTYDEKAVLAAASESVEINGRSYPVIRLQWECSGTLAATGVVREKAQTEYYILGYFGDFIK